MVAKTLRSLQLLSIFILVASCGRGGDSITVSSTNFGDEVALQQNLAFTFSDHVVSEDQVGVWTALQHALPGIIMPLIMVVMLTRFFGNYASMI
jgi:lactate permease